MPEAGATPALPDTIPSNVWEQALSDPDASFLWLFETHPDAMWIYDPVTLAIADANDAAVRNYGYSREEFLSRTVDHLHPVNEFSTLRDKIARGDGPIWCRHLKKDGTLFGVGLIPRLIHFRGRRCVLVQTPGVTASNGSELLYQTLVDSIPVSVLVIDERMNVTLANHKFLEKARRFRLDTLGKPLSKVFPAVILDELGLLKQIRQAFQTGKGVQGERLSYRAPGLPQRIYYYNLVPIHSGSRVEHVLLVMDDVTEQIRLGEEIRRVESHLASVVESANEIVLSTDVAGRISSWNHAAERTTGFRPDEVQDGDLYRLLSERSRPAFEALCSDIEHHGTAHNTDCELVTKKGTFIPVSWVLSPLKDGSGKVVGMVAVGRDLTEHREFEQQIRQSEKLAAMGVMAGGIAHEVRTPLAIASSAAQFLMEKDISDEFRRECAAKVHLGIERATDIVENLLRFARPMSTEMTTVDLPDVIRDVVLLISNQARAQQIEIVLCLPAPPVRLEGSASLLQQVFLNLFLNALRAMPQGGTLTVSTQLIREEVVTRVSDTGCGIARADIARIFDPFYTTAPVGQGTGLGLAICYSIIQQHGGSISAESSLGQGSTFILRLPAV
jgi:PAS domain S-box-containing protein